MTTNDIRTKFLNFFKSKGHSIIASDSLVPKDDPTVLFTTAGMQQFKPQFLGHIDGFTRAATCQKCLRTDDLDVVGKTDFHHTFFEMLGNFSFGDYFKKEAIHWAWEFLTRELGIPSQKLWVSVYKEDDEAYNIWLNEIKVSANKIVKLGDKSNFWPSNARLNGPNGPCGPCSEIFYDYGVNPDCSKGDQCDPDCSCGRFSEVWNLVFTQFNRKDGGVLEPLPAKNIDTGMGLERLAAVVQGKKSNYDTDNFAAILKVIKDTFADNGAKATTSEYRIIADHIRAVTVGIADGVMPSNEGRGYVMRKLIVDMSDLAILAGIEKPVIHTLVDIVIERLGDSYSELLGKANEIKELIKRIEEGFIKIRKEKLPELDKQIAEIVKLQDRQERVTKLGKLLFLYRDTHGLTYDTMYQVVLSHYLQNTEDVLAMSEIYVDLMKQQQERSRAGSKMTGDVFVTQDFTLNLPKTEFLGYQETKSGAEVLKVLNDKGEIYEAYQGQAVKVILNRTPFYAEAGGQVGDSGYLLAPNGKMRVTDTQKTNDIYIHIGVIEHGGIKTGDKLVVSVDGPRRNSIMRNHTATHLLQAALRETLGSHIKQQGSLVEEGRLRFDFTHPVGVKPDEMQKIENRLNDFISRADKVTTEVLALEEAKKKGALAFFAEKYGQTVRVVSIGDYSREFCGGTHVTSTGEIEAMKITSEGSVAQGIRRIEAVTGKSKVQEFLNKKQDELAAIEEAQRKKQEELNAQKANFDRIKSSIDGIIDSAENIKGVSVVSYYLKDGDIQTLRKVSDLFKQKLSSAVVVLGTSGTNTVSLIISASDDVVAKGVRANELISKVGPLIEGSGGGRPNMAQAGGKAVNKLSEAMDKAKELIKQVLQ